MNRFVRTTIVFALISGVLLGPLTWILSRYWLWPPAFQIVLWVGLSVYALTLARWSQTRLLSIVFPLLFLLVMTLTVDLGGVYVPMAAVILGWVRSGICFKGNPIRLLMAEGVTLGGGLVLVYLLMGTSLISWSLGLCLFGLIQSLYFFIVSDRSMEAVRPADVDPFEQALHEAERILGAR